MPDFQLGDHQNVDVVIALLDADGVTTKDAPDAGSVVAAFASGVELTATVSPDQTSVNVRANGPVTTGDVLTVSANFNGQPLTPATLAFDVLTGPPVAVTLTPGTPVTN
jgi:hypothetical protein